MASLSRFPSVVYDFRRRTCALESYDAAGNLTTRVDGAGTNIALFPKTSTFTYDCVRPDNRPPPPRGFRG
jgi:hypothetical protein